MRRFSPKMPKSSSSPPSTTSNPRPCSALPEGEYEQMLATLAVLRGPVDNFFDNVMVNAEDPALRATRQALLKRLYDVMNKVAEIARLAK